MTSVTPAISESRSPSPLVVFNSTPIAPIPSSSRPYSIESPSYNPNEEGNETVSATTGVKEPDHKPSGLGSTLAYAATSLPTSNPTSGTKSQLAIGLGMGFGFTFGLIASICVIWKVTCRLMSSNTAASNNKIAPGDFSEVVTKDRPTETRAKSTKQEPIAPRDETPIDEDDLYGGDYEIR